MRGWSIMSKIFYTTNKNTALKMVYQLLSKLNDQDKLWVANEVLETFKAENLIFGKIK